MLRDNLYFAILWDGECTSQQAGKIKLSVTRHWPSALQKHTAGEMTALGIGKSADSELRQLGAGRTITFSALTITGKLESEPIGRFSPPALTHQECAAYRPPLQP